MADNDIARRGYMNVVRNPRDGVVSVEIFDIKFTQSKLNNVLGFLSQWTAPKL